VYVSLVLRRQKGATNKYSNLDDCYIEGIMEGQAMKDIENGSKSFGTIWIL
jgi:hypothetical protein